MLISRRHTRRRCDTPTQAQSGCRRRRYASFGLSVRSECMRQSAIRSDADGGARCDTSSACDGSAAALRPMLTSLRSRYVIAPLARAAAAMFYCCAEAMPTTLTIGAALRCLPRRYDMQMKPDTRCLCCQCEAASSVKRKGRAQQRSAQRRWCSACSAEWRAQAQCARRGAQRRYGVHADIFTAHARGQHAHPVRPEQRHQRHRWTASFTSSPITSEPRPRRVPPTMSPSFIDKVHDITPLERSPTSSHPPSRRRSSVARLTQPPSRPRHDGV